MRIHQTNLEPVPSDHAPPSTIWSRVLAAGSAAKLCAACGSKQHVVSDLRCGGLPFCADCIEHTRDLTEWDDIGQVD